MHSTRLGLRARVALTFAILGLVVSTCVAMVAVHFSDSYVDRLVEEMLRVEGDYLRARFSVDDKLPRPHTRHFYEFTRGAGSTDPPPAEIAALGPGFHELDDPDGGERHVAIYDLHGQRLYIVLDIGRESIRERRFARDLLALVAFGTGLSAWLGWLWAGRAIEPVRRLAGRVETLEPNSRGTTMLAADFADDEVGALARTFDRFQERLYKFVRRERAFTADASHEMRTPLAVIRGAIEVFLDRNGNDPANLARLRRMQRGTDELSDLLDALLVLARGEELDGEASGTTDLGVVVNQILRDRADAFNAKGLIVDLHADAPVMLSAPRCVLDVVARNLLRAATEFAESGTLIVAVDPTRLHIAYRQSERANSACATPSASAKESADRISGLSMIRRVCERRKWKLEENTDVPGARNFTLILAPESAVQTGKLSQP
ncbi:MAG: HAMP domain-containing sensor histidine kinase [Rudaea sp.]